MFVVAVKMLSSFSKPTSMSPQNPMSIVIAEAPVFETSTTHSIEFPTTRVPVAVTEVVDGSGDV